MPKSASSGVSFRPSLPFILLSLLLVILWLAGGASRGDVFGQVVVRATTFLVLIVLIVFGRRLTLTSAGPTWIFLWAAVSIAALQLLPLPPGLWQMLPGREIVGEGAAGAAGEIWRSWSLVPGATVNALIALVVPLTVLLLTTALVRNEAAWLPGLVLALVAASTLLGLLQFSGAGIDNPLVNDTPGVVSGTFANRNHFALFLALGCLLVPVWMFRENRRLGWRGPAGLGLLLLFVLTILASGSRAGIALGILAIVLAGIMAERGLRRELRHAPRWVFPAIVMGVVGLLASLVLVSVAADRAVSIQRGLSIDVEQDMRSRAFPTVWAMTRAAFPAGNGLGSFDPMFRIHESFTLLKPTYFNQAHNDLLGVVLDAGLPGLLLLVAGLGWWAWASVMAWRGSADRQSMLPQLGSSILLLVIVASAFDYPARTPLMMAMMVFAFVWLSGATSRNGTSALRGSGQHL